MTKGAGLRPSSIAAALVVSGVTHYVADRRRPLKRLAVRLRKNGFYAQMTPVCGPFELDQSWHRGWEAVASIVAAR